MKQKFMSILLGILLATIIASTLTACGNNQEATSSSAQTANADENIDSSNISSDTSSPAFPEETALDNIELSIPEEFEMDNSTADGTYTLFTLKTPSSDNNNSNVTGNNNSNVTGNNNSNVTGNDNSNGTGNDNSNGTGNDSSNNGNDANNVTIRVINVQTTASDFQDSLNNPATPESMTEYLTSVLNYSDVIFTDYNRDVTDDQIRCEYKFTYTVSGRQYTELEFSCTTKDKFIAITVRPKSEAYLQQAEQVFRQVVDSFNPYK